MVFLSNFSDGYTGGSLLMAKLSESSLAFNEAEWDSHLGAESGKMDYEFYGVNIMSDGNKSCFLVLNKGGNVVKSELNNTWLLGSCLSITLSFLSCLLLKSLGLLLFSFGRVFGEEFKELVS